MVFLVGLIYRSGTLPNHPFLYAFVLRPTQDEGFSFFSAVCSAFSTSFASLSAPLAFAISQA